MINPDQAAEILAGYQVKDWEARRRAAIAALPSALQDILWILLGYDENGKQPKAQDWMAQRAARWGAAQQLEALPDADRQLIFESLFPKIAPQIEAAWQLQKQFPYQTSWNRRAFRAPHSPALTLARRTNWLDTMLAITSNYEQDVLWLARWAAYLGHYGRSEALGVLFAATIESAAETGDQVFDILMASAKGEHEVGAMGRHVSQGLLSASRPEGWTLIEQMLLAAQRQEGLRQVILETVDEAHPEAFRRMVRLIQTQNLARFSSVVRAVDVWLGLQWEAADSRAVGQTLARLDALLHDPAQRATGLSSDDPQELYLALCVSGFENAQAAAEQAGPFLEHSSPEHRFATTYFLAQLGLPEARKALIPKLTDPDLRIATVAFEAVQPAYHNNTGDLPPTLFEQIEAAIPHFPAKKKALQPLVWPWFKLTAGRQMLVNGLYGALGERPYKRLYPYLSMMDTGVRARVVSEYIAKDEKGWDAETRDVILKLMGDRSAHVREAAIKAATGMTLKTEDARQLEGYLTRKTGDLRRGVLGLLLNQSDADALASARRLLQGKQALQLQAGLELLRQLKEAKRADKKVQALANAYTGEQQSPTAGEQTLLEAILDRQPEPATLDDGLGLFDPAQRTPPTTPKGQTGLFKTSLIPKNSAAAACLQALDDLIHTHRETPINIYGWQGDRREELLGNLQWGLPMPDPKEPLDEEMARFPLAEIWQTWWVERPGSLRDQDGYESFRTLAQFENTYLHIPRHMLKEPPQWFQKIKRELFGQIDLSKLRYPSLIRSIMWWLVRVSPPKQAVDFLLNGVEHTFHLIHGQKPLRQEGDVQPEGLLGWLNLARAYYQVCPNEWQGDHHVRLWHLLRWLDDFPWVTNHSHSKIDEIMRAYQAGGATKADIFYNLIGPRKEHSRYAWYGVDFDSLRNLSGRKPGPYYSHIAADPALQECVDRCRQRIVDIECGRGDIPTAASHPALALRYSGPMDALLRLLRAFGKEAFERGWTYDSLSKKAIFSHLIRSSFPAETDTPQTFAEAASRYKINRKRLVETAIYAPQWANHIAVALNWAGFTEAVWWFHAHTKDHRWQVDQAIREVWQAQISERTPLTGQDLLDGAVDVAWFRRIYAVLGPERWAELDRAAKFASGGGGHKRAQLFADAMLGRLDEETLIKRITQKRHQDSVRALGLLPLPGDASPDDAILSRYEIIQEFLRGSRKFGSQRQASEKLAARIGLENLARTADFPDPLRLEWAMEARAVADLAGGPISVTRDAVTVSLAIDECGEPQLSITKQDRPLKAVPAKLKKQPDIAVLLERRREIKKQASRMRLSLEQAMCRGDRFSGAELQQLLGHPILRPMLTQLVFTGDAVSGYPDAGGRQLNGLRGQSHPLTPETELRVAHPHDLLLTNEWHTWQAECFKQEVIQPFKQVFRELYIPTAAEADGGAVSHRYAGHQVNPRQALALLGGRGWVSHPEEGVQRTFHDEDITVRLAFQEGIYTPAEVEGLTLEGVQFSRRSEWKLLPLDQIPPRLFSEVMRDLDLVVSVAHQGGVDPEASASTVEMRSALIDQTCAMLNLTNVRLKQNHAFVDGKLNHYSVHLGSGVVHQQPGGHLCLVPVHSQHRGRLFLPFADDDPKTAEVISKILLLAQDQNIKDPSILEQILPRT